MDKAAPKADLFKANLERAAPLLAKLKEDGVKHMIDGQIACRRQRARQGRARHCRGH